MGEQVGAGHAQDHLEDVDEKQPQHEHVQGGKPLVDQDLVDDHLREERRDQPERLKEDEGDGGGVPRGKCTAQALGIRRYPRNARSYRQGDDGILHQRRRTGESGALRPRFSISLSGEDDQDIPRVDGLPAPHPNLRHRAVGGGKDLVLHLHGLEKQNEIAGLDDAADRDLDVEDLARHGRGDG